MTKEEYLAIFEKRYEEFEKLKNAGDFYNYEKNFVKFIQDLGKECMESQLNENTETENRRRKKKQ